MRATPHTPHAEAVSGTPSEATLLWPARQGSLSLPYMASRCVPSTRGENIALMHAERNTLHSQHYEALRATLSTMPEINVSAETDHQLSLLASWEGTSKGEVVARLLTNLSKSQTRSDDTVAVHKVYERERIEGIYDPPSSTLTITSAPWSGEVFSKPSSAAIAVVQHFKPDANPNRNGWDFWRVTETGAPLQSLRSHR